jgi:hypothetical protein
MTPEVEKALTPDVAEAIRELAEKYPSAAITARPDEQGGAFVVVDEVPLGAPYSQPGSWVGFHVTHTCPYADVYPLFVRGDLRRIDGGALGEAITAGHTFEGRPALQLSRRANHRDNSGIETPLIKLLKVLQWLKSR